MLSTGGRSCGPMVCCIKTEEGAGQPEGFS